MKRHAPHQYQFIHISKQYLKLLTPLLFVLKWEIDQNGFDNPYLLKQMLRKDFPTTWMLYSFKFNINDFLWQPSRHKKEILAF